tara:strand:+ start:68 stop:1072 length:1005 start_codon:yes stop_codon:yes gene_type:complete
MKRIVLFYRAAFILGLVVVCLSSCFNRSEKVKLRVNRFEQELFSINTENIIEKSSKWDDGFGSFNKVFSTQIIKASQFNDEQYYNDLLAFTKDKDMREAYDSTVLLFSDFSEIQNNLELAFGRFAVMFSSYPIPEITTFFGGFNFGVVTYDNNIAIGLESFLGQNSKYYKYLGDPRYLRFQKQKKFLLSNVMEVWFNEFFKKYLTGRDLLSQIVYKGKMMYFLDKMLPELALEDKFRFSREQMDWVAENEANIWEYFIHEDLLFSKEENKFRSFVSYAPFAKGMPKEAPGRVAYFIGYKMVDEYMRNNKIDIEGLMCLTDSREFLRQSKYKPTK